jgi:uncharacterized protein (TIGR03435 family)
MKGIIGVALFVVCGTHLLAQSAPQVPLTFEVASIKPAKQATAGGGGFPPGRFFMSHATLQTLVRLAYDVPDYRVINGGPSWIGSDEFEVDARAPTISGTLATQAQVKRMLQALLQERFKLTIRRETRDMPNYQLVFARPDRRLGQKLRRSQSDCATPEGRNRARAAATGGRFPCYTTMGPTPGGQMLFTADGIEFAQLVEFAAQRLRRTIRNDTDLSGLFDWEFSWADELEVDGPAFLTAFEEQLGLKLESGRGPVELLVIDSAERPTPN